MKTIAIIGLGNIGKRHLQAALALDLDLKIFCIDIIEPDFSEFDITKTDNIVFSKSINDLPKSINTVIIATSAAIRRTVFEELISNCVVRNIVFEKVLFQKEEDYIYVDKVIKTKNIHAWVDCPRRINTSWKRIKNLIDENNEFSFIVSGGNWGLGCNAIHYFDVIKWLTGDNDIQITSFAKYGEIFESKRTGYKEICGIVEGHGGKCRYFSISCTPNPMTTQIYIFSENRRIVLLNDETEMVIEDGDNRWLERREKMQPTYVSETTKIVLTDIIERGKCELISWDDSMYLHLMWLRSLFPIFNEKGYKKGLCPIT